MNPVARITIHPTQFPENVRRDLAESLRNRQVNHKFHYDSFKQTRKWLALHDACSPARSDPDCAAIYDRSFEAAARIDGQRLHVVGLGCGGGQKDARLLELLAPRQRDVSYVPCDVSTAMVLVARQAALAMIPDRSCFPLVCDLASATDLPVVLDQMLPSDALRLVTFFGMIPNFEPRAILPKLASVVRHGDTLLFSANLAPGPDYADGLKRILPQYDNSLTREWLITFLLDLGVDRSDGEIRFAIEEQPPGSGIKRVAAYFHFSRPCKLSVDSEPFEFRTGESIRLFFSYRYTPSLIQKLLAEHGLKVSDTWITSSGEEGVFLATVPRGA